MKKSWIIRDSRNGIDLYEASSKVEAQKKLKIYFDHLSMISLSASMDDYEIVEREY